MLIHKTKKDLTIHTKLTTKSETENDFSKSQLNILKF